MTTSLIAEVLDTPDGQRPQASIMVGRAGRTIALRGDDAAALRPGTIARITPDGDVLALLAEADTARANLYRIFARYRVAPDHAAEVEAEAQAWTEDPGFYEPDLEDLEHLAFCTIDNEDSRDLDQALYIADVGDAWEVWYALSDAAYYVRPGTALFEDALSRGASFYLPGLVAPMLPRVLSEDLVSLNEGVPRRALTMVMTVAKDDARCTGTRFLRGRIRSRAKLSFIGVQAYYDDPASSPLAGRDFSETLDLLREVGLARIARAESKDVVRYNRVSAGIAFSDAAGRRFVAVDDTRNATDRYNEQISLLCNIEGAKLLAEAAETDRGPHAIFRVHPPPRDPEIHRLERTIRGLIRARDLDPAVWRWRRRRRRGRDGESLAAYLDRLPKDGEHAALFMAIQRQALLVNQRSTFQAEPGLHHGVGAAVYARFSSPMREIVGIFTHKEALDVIARRRPEATDALLQEQVIEAGNRAKDIQRRLTNEANLLVIDDVLSADLALPVDERPYRDANVLGLRHDRLYVQLLDPPLELKVYLRDLGRYLDAEVDTDGVAVTLRRDEEEVTFRMGDTISLRVRAHDHPRRRWVLCPRSAEALV